MERTITLTPAYGRNPRTAVDAFREFAAGKDWTIASIHTYSGAYCSIRDLAGYRVTLRYNHLRDSCVVNQKPRTRVGSETGAQASKKSTDSHLYCNKCNKNLLTTPAGDFVFDDMTSLCDCSWRCCDHSVSGPGNHGTHLSNRPVCV